MTYVFKKPARTVTRVFVHCSASDRPEHDSAAVIDQWHRQNGWAGIGYHFFIRKDGVLEIGRDLEKVPAAQAGHNAGTIAICLHGLEKDRFTPDQFDTLGELCLQIKEAYQGQVTFHGHCEVAKKACPVIDYRNTLALDAAGVMHDGPSRNRGWIPTPAANGQDLEVLPITVQTLRQGDRGDLVQGLQKMLAGLGYHVGDIDGVFGGRTRSAVLALQADNSLIADGIVGPLTREILASAPARAIAPLRAAASLGDLAADGSRIAQASIRNGVVGALLGGTGLAAILDDMTGAISLITGQSDALQRVIAEHGAITGGVILAAGAFVAWQSWRAGKARVEDHRTGKTA